MKKLSILYVEDDVFEKKLFEKVVTGLSIPIDFTILSDAESAITHLNSSRNVPDLILTDNFLPGISGFELVAELRKRIKSRKIPIIVLSNLLHSTELEKANLIQPDRYIQKPWDMEDYKEMIANLCYDQMELKFKDKGIV